MSDVYPGIENTLVYERIRTCLKNRQPIHFINEFTLPDGNLGYYELRFRPVPEGVLIMSLDITDSKQKELALQSQKSELETNLKLILNSTNMAYILLDSDLKVVTVNQAAIHFAEKELKVREVLASDFLSYVRNDKKSRYEEHINSALRGNEVFYDSMYEQEDGSENWYEVKYTPLLDANKKLYRLLISIENITKRKREALQLEKQLNLFEELSFITSHELRHEYAKLHGIVNLLNDVDEIDEEFKSILKNSQNIFNQLNSSILKLNDRINLSQSSTILHRIKTYPIERFVLLDHDKTNNLVNKRIIEKAIAGLPVESFSNPKDYCQRTIDSKPSRELLFLDLNMPEMSGWEVLEALKEAELNLPVVILTSSVDQNDTERALLYPTIVCFIHKPLTVELVKELSRDFQLSIQ